MEEDIYRHGKIIIPIDSDGLLTIQIEGKLVRLYKATREIVDIMDTLNLHLSRHLFRRHSPSTLNPTKNNQLIVPAPLTLVT